MDKKLKIRACRVTKVAVTIITTTIVMSIGGLMWMRANAVPETEVGWWKLFLGYVPPEAKDSHLYQETLSPFRKWISPPRGKYVEFALLADMVSCVYNPIDNPNRPIRFMQNVNDDENCKFANDWSATLRSTDNMKIISEWPSDKNGKALEWQVGFQDKKIDKALLLVFNVTANGKLRPARIKVISHSRISDQPQDDENKFLSFHPRLAQSVALFERNFIIPEAMKAKGIVHGL